MDIRTREAVRYLGYGKCAVDEKILQDIKDSFRELDNLAEKKSIYRTFKLSVKGENRLGIENVEICSRNLRMNLNDCHEVIIFGATLGVEIDRQIRKYQLVDMSKAVIMQACAAVVLEEYCDEWQSQIREQLRMEGKYLRPRFSPGYGDFSIFHQKDLLAMLESSKKIGLTMTESYMLTPTKSVTAVIGISYKEMHCHQNGCEECSKTDCTYRRS